MSLRFRKHQRILKNRDFRRMYASQQRGGTALFTYHVMPDQNSHDKQQCSKLGVTVSKKVSKAAVHRNRIKRQVKEFYRLNQHDLTSTSLVITAKRGCAEASDEQRWAELAQLWEKVMRWQAWYQRQQAKLPNETPTVQQ